ncbi:MAG: exodeoxyribonuclease VII small subunit [Coprococcus sp.]|nr:exodeoxyribonuclease VII small subunit [Coprococcus sp.]
MAEREEKVQEEENKTLEQLFAGLDDVVEKLEEGSTSLEESFRLYQKGMEMLKMCNDKIDTVEKKVLILEENGEIHEF